MMDCEADRLATFVGHWSEDSFVKPEALAKAGFYYIGPFDRVRCFECKGAVYNWVQGDDAVGEHLRFFPKCTFIQGLLSKPLMKLQNREGKALSLLGYSDGDILHAFNWLEENGMFFFSLSLSYFENLFLVFFFL